MEPLRQGPELPQEVAACAPGEEGVLGNCAQGEGTWAMERMSALLLLGREPGFHQSRKKAYYVQL